MRNTISLLLFLLSFYALGQRVSFEDPDLTFSFKKPKNWHVFDDGYVVKVAPSVKDSASTYFSITYFEDAQPSRDIQFADSIDSTSNPCLGKTKIAGVLTKYCVETTSNAIQTQYHFTKYGQRFELVTLQPSPIKDPRNIVVFNHIIRSIRIAK